MNIENTHRLLKEGRLKKTKLRLALLKCFMDCHSAQSYTDIKNKLGQEVDKSTLYRNLSAFEEAGLIHRINDHTGISKYAFGNVKDPHHNHAHFVCESCNTVYCMDDIQIEELNVPQGFKAKSVQTILRGTCSDC